jgi:hypothetical protein
VPQLLARCERFPFLAPNFLGELHPLFAQHGTYASYAPLASESICFGAAVRLKKLINAQ